MSFNTDSTIFPEKIIRTTGEDGTSYTSRVYSLETWRNLGFLGVILMILLVALFGPIVPALFLLFYCIDIHRDPKLWNILAIGVAIYMLIDLHNGWILSIIMSPFYNAKELIYVTYVCGAMILANIVVLFFGPVFYSISHGKKFLSFLYVVGVSIICYSISKYVFTHNIIKIF